MQCPKCGGEVPDSDYVCGACGAYARGATDGAPREGTDARLSAPLDPPPIGSHPYPLPQPRRPPLGYPTGSEGPDCAYPSMYGWPGLAPPEQPWDVSQSRYRIPHPEGLPPEAAMTAIRQASIETMLAYEARRTARRWARWSFVLAALALVFPIFFGPIGFASGYIAWRLGEKRLGRIGAALSAVGMLAGILFAALVLSIQPRG